MKSRSPTGELVVVGSLLAAGACAVAFVVLYVVDAPTRSCSALTPRRGARVPGRRRRARGRRTVVVQRKWRRGPRPRGRQEEASEEVAERARRAARGRVAAQLMLGAAGAGGRRRRAWRAIAPLASLGPDSLRGAERPRRGGRACRWSTSTAAALRADQLEIGSFDHGVPEGADKRELGSPVVVVRARSERAQAAAQRAGPSTGILAYSKICTHAGCAVAIFRYPLYEPHSQPARRWSAPATTRRSTCARAPRSVFGPAGRPLPQLPLALAADGTLVAAGPMSGPSARPGGGCSDELIGRCVRRAARPARRRERLGCLVRKGLRYVFPDHWSFLFGEIALYCVHRPGRHGASTSRSSSSPPRDTSIYHGSVRAAAGRPDVSDAYRSTLDLSLDVPAGLLMRQTHHWAALVFVAAIVAAPDAHLLHRRVPQARASSTGYIGLTMLTLAHRSRASPATRCPTTCSRAWAWRSPTRSRCRSRWSAARWRCWSGAASSRAPSAFESPHLHPPRAASLPALIGGADRRAPGADHAPASTPSSPGPGGRERNVVGTPLWPAYALRSRRAVLRRRGGAVPARRAGADQPGVAVRPVRSRGSAPTAPSPTGTWAG